MMTQESRLATFDMVLLGSSQSCLNIGGNMNCQTVNKKAKSPCPMEQINIASVNCQIRTIRLENVTKLEDVQHFLHWLCVKLGLLKNKPRCYLLEPVNAIQFVNTAHNFQGKGVIM